MTCSGVVSSHRGVWVEMLEGRRMLSGLVVTSGAVGTDTSTSSQIAALALDNPVGAHINAAAVRDQLIHFVDTWNGGQAGKFGTSGMGVYASNWDGLFRMNLDRQFNPIHYYTDDQTIISQSRAIFDNAQAYLNAPVTEQARFKAAVQKGADYLLSHASDPATYNGNPGGMWWGLQSDGVSPPTHTTSIFGNLPRDKQAYGQVQTILALATAYRVTGDQRHLDGALEQLQVCNTQFADTAAGAGAYLPSANENYTQRVDTRNVDYMTHALEAMLSVYDVLSAADPLRTQVATQITNIGNFITTRMYRDVAGSTTEGYLPWYYDASWQPSSDPAQQFVTPGHNFEMAFLLSRAVEHGFNSNWLNVANKLVNYAMHYGFDNNTGSMTRGAVLYDHLNFNGTPFGSTSQDLVWWEESEAARALLHFAAVRGRTDFWPAFDAANAFINNHFVDSTYGGWYQTLSATTLAPTNTDKGTVWTGGYHESMLYAEMLRLAPAQSVPFTGTPINIPTSGSISVEAENFDLGGEGIAYHDSDLANRGGKYRTSEGVDIESASDTSGIYDVGWAAAGEWLNYSVNVAAAGLYSIDLRVANTGSGGTVHLEVDGSNVTGPMSITNSGGWQNWTTITKTNVLLPAGQHILQLVMDTVGSSGAVGNFNWIRIYTAQPPAQTPFHTVPFAIGSSPVTIQAEDYDFGGEATAYHDTDASNDGGQYRNMDAVDIENTSDAGGGYDVGWIQAGEWLEYTVNVAVAGLYNVDLRAASMGNNGTVHLELDGLNISGSLILPNTGGWQNWTSISKGKVNFPAGQHVLRLAMDTNASNGWVGNVNWIRISPASSGPTQTPFNGTPFSISAGGTTIQYEDFDKGGEGVAYHDSDASNLGGQYRPTEAVDIQTTNDTGGGYNVGWTSAGEWLEYSVDVLDPGSYAIDFRVASNGTGGNFHVEVDGANVSGPLGVPNTFGWQNWSTLRTNGINLTSGDHILRLVMDSVGPSSATGNFNWMKFTKIA